MTKKRPGKKRAKSAVRGKKRAAKPAKKKSVRTSSRRKRVAKKTRKSSSAKALRATPSRRRTARPRNRPANNFADVESGDLQGLSRGETVDSESVDELLEEGNAFEAGVVSGVEEADDSEGREVHTHEVPEDDVPEEYLDEK